MCTRKHAKRHRQAMQGAAWQDGSRTHIRDVVLVVIETRDANSPHKGKLAQYPQQVDAMPHLSEEAVAATPPCLAPQAHEAGTVGPQVAGPEKVYNAASPPMHARHVSLAAMHRP